MASTLAPIGAPYAGQLGLLQRLRAGVFRLTNSGAETTFTVTAALAGMNFILAVIAMDESAAAAVRYNPTVDASNGLYTQVALTFTAGDELTLLVLGV